MSTEVLTNGFYFDLGLVLLLVLGWAVYRYLTYWRHERRHRRQVEQHLAATDHRTTPHGRTEWGWPSRQESHRLRDS